ncbi:porin [Pseudomonas sp.]|uniref:porin n=1 Tax=Pseudomonas sp. TaxID=306 RepID=UPI0019E82123|nr:porin [Pseudomonas sp.]MBF0675141.1 porin [Pseudomonas sp.]
MTALRVIGLAAACLAITPAFALDQGDYRLNAFGTVGVTYLGGEEDGRSYGINGQTTDAWRGDQLSKFGTQLSYGLTDSLNATAQLTAKAEQDSWEANLEWAYLAWQANDQLLLRAGRLRTPAYMYSETLDVGFSYPWLRLPDEVYGQIQLSNYEGVDVVYSLPLSFATLSVQAVAGQAKDRDYYLFDEFYDTDWDNLLGASLSLASNNYGTLRVAYNQATLTIDQPLLGIADSKGSFLSVGYQYDDGSWISANEWTQRTIDGPLSPDQNAFYLMGGRRFGDFLPHLTYAQLDEEKGARQSSWTLGLNYSLAPNMTLKGEYKQIETENNFEGMFVPSGLEVFTQSIPNFDGEIVSVGIDFVF